MQRGQEKGGHRGDRLVGRDDTFLRQSGDYTVQASTNGTDGMDAAAVCSFLQATSWAKGFSAEQLQEAFRNSLCFSLFTDERQIGFARVITDRVTFAYVCDVYIAEEFRGRGLGTFLMQCTLEHPAVSTLRRVALITHDAQKFYRRMGFGPSAQADSYMEKVLGSKPV